uniref:RHS repeat domain-containing protein n=1 Tax=Maribacter sp. 2-571 TaxID=3417569 RepID=UPI003D34122E
MASSEKLAPSLYNGNISAVLWRKANTDDSSLKYYNYSYDALNRITAATDDTGHYNLSNVGYDLNGNILGLDRKGHTNAGATTFGDMDDLDYVYDSGNRLLKVTDGINGTAGQGGFRDANGNGVEYGYDTNGNMTSDANKGITDIQYNHLNLPVAVAIDGGTISYVYDATGSKLKKIKTETGQNPKTVTEYASGYVYEGNDTATSLQFFNTAEGYVEPRNTEDLSQGYNYIYQYSDHLGNVRLSYTDADSDGAIDPNTEIVKESNYYPFGLEHKGYNGSVSALGNSVAKRYMFGDKEYNQELGLDWYDVTARNYDPALGRWMNIDLLAEVQEDFTPYHYSYNSPITFSDPTGTIPVYQSTGQATTVINKDDPSQTYFIDDGYDFDFYVSDEDFQTIVNNSNGSVLPSSKLPATTVARWVSEAT